jgi:hypothetical protein
LAKAKMLLVELMQQATASGHLAMRSTSLLEITFMASKDCL